MPTPTERILDHKFVPNHQLAVLTARFGTRLATYDAIYRAAQWHVTRYNIRGVFGFNVQVAGYRVWVTGNVVSGTVRLSNAWIK